MEVVPRIFFRTLSNVDVKVDAKELTWTKYTVAEVMLTARRIEQFDKYQFVEATLDVVSETFLLHITTLKVPVLIMTVDFTKKLLLSTLK